MNSKQQDVSIGDIYSQLRAECPDFHTVVAAVMKGAKHVESVSSQNHLKTFCFFFWYSVQRCNCLDYCLT